jgi:hypothetical protein
MGATLEINDNLNQLFISGIAYKSNLISEVIEFIVLTNSGNTDLNLSEFAFTKGITFQFPEYALIHAKQSIYISNNSSSTFWLGKGLTVYQWESGHLADEGEGIQLETPQGIIVDYIYYNRDIT